MNRSFRVFLVFLTLFTILTGSYNNTATASSNVNARITSLTGEVTIKLAGGSYPIPAFSNMPLHQGDQIITGDDGSLTIHVSQPESDRTFGPNTKATITKLSESRSGNKFSIKLWTGSIWNSVELLKGTDEDVVETPGSRLNVRGTNFLVIVNPDGLLSVFVASGVVAATFDNSPSASDVLVAPTQQLQVLPTQLPSALQDALSIINISDLVEHSDLSILKAFIISAPSIILENNDLMKNLQKSLDNNILPVIARNGDRSDISIISQKDLDAYATNLNNLLSQLAREAIQLSPDHSSEMIKLIEAINEQIPGSNQDIQLEGDASMNPLAGISPSTVGDKEKEQLRLEVIRLEAEKKRILLESTLLAQLNASLQSILEKQKVLDEANKDVLEQLRVSAENIYISHLTPEELERFQDAKQQPGSAVNPNPVTETPEQPSNPAIVPNVTLLQTNTSKGFDLSIRLKQFTGSKAIYAAQFHFISSTTIKAGNEKDRFLNDNFFDPLNSVDMINSKTGTIGMNETIMTETIYAATQFGVATNVSITNDIFATIPFISTGNGTIKLSYLKIVDHNGKTVLELTEGGPGMPPLIPYTK